MCVYKVCVCILFSYCLFMSRQKRNPNFHHTTSKPKHTPTHTSLLKKHTNLSMCVCTCICVCVHDNIKPKAWRTYPHSHIKGDDDEGARVAFSSIACHFRVERGWGVSQCVYRFENWTNEMVSFSILWEGIVRKKIFLEVFFSASFCFFLSGDFLSSHVGFSSLPK